MMLLHSADTCQSSLVSLASSTVQCTTVCLAEQGVDRPCNERMLQAHYGQANALCISLTTADCELRTSMHSASSHMTRVVYCRGVYPSKLSGQVRSIEF